MGFFLLNGKWNDLKTCSTPLKTSWKKKTTKASKPVCSSVFIIILQLLVLPPWTRRDKHGSVWWPEARPLADIFWSPRQSNGFVLLWTQNRSAHSQTGSKEQSKGLGHNFPESRSTVTGRDKHLYLWLAGSQQHLQTRQCFYQCVKWEAAPSLSEQRTGLWVTFPLSSQGGGIQIF